MYEREEGGPGVNDLLNSWLEFYIFMFNRSRQFLVSPLKSHRTCVKGSRLRKCREERSRMLPRRYG